MHVLLQNRGNRDSPVSHLDAWKCLSPIYGSMSDFDDNSIPTLQLNKLSSNQLPNQSLISSCEENENENENDLLDSLHAYTPMKFSTCLEAGISKDVRVDPNNVKQTIDLALLDANDEDEEELYQIFESSKTLLNPCQTGVINPMTSKLDGYHLFPFPTFEIVPN